MRVIIYDMRDAKEPGDRQIVLRMVDDTGCLRVQSLIYGTEDFAQNLGEVLANAFGTELQWVGPSAMAAADAVMELSPNMLLLSNQRQLDLF